VETALSEESLYADERRKVLRIPGSEPASVVAYEYKQRRRPMVAQDVWWFQDGVPVGKARYQLTLPAVLGVSQLLAERDSTQTRTDGGMTPGRGSFRICRLSKRNLLCPRGKHWLAAWASSTTCPQVLPAEIEGLGKTSGPGTRRSSAAQG
jgi:hypothetical protein